MTPMSPHDRAAAVGDFTPPSTGPGHLLDATDARMYAAAHLLLDARPADRFRGENETVDPVAGHIPGAVNVPALANVDREGRFVSAAALAATFTVVGVHANANANETKIIGTYCGSGVQATHLALALTVAGITGGVDVYIGSWSEWVTDPARAVEV